MGKKFIIGVDEVGRGALAGPIVVAAFAASTKLRIQNQELRVRNKSANSKLFLILNTKSVKLKDSKKLTPKQREIWFEYVKKNQKQKAKDQKLYYAVAGVSPKVIDKIGISKAANLAATNALRALIKNYKLKIKNCRIFLDGGLFLNSKSLAINSVTLVKGDELIPEIMLASIIAKVSRDRLMEKIHRKYPQYKFNQNKGYGTKAHFQAIKKYGLLPIHRKSFKIKQ